MTKKPSSEKHEKKIEKLHAEIDSLKNLSKNFDFISDNIPDVLYQLDSEGIISYINNAVTKYGYKPEDLIGKSIFEIVHPDDKEKVKYRLNERRTGLRATKDLKVRLFTKEGEEKTFETRAGIGEKPVFSISAEGLYKPDNPSSKTFQGTQGIARDITDREVMNEQAKELEKRLLLQVERMPIGLIFWDKDFRVKSWNPAAENIFGFTSEEMLGKHPYGFIVPKDSQPHVNDIWCRLLEGDMTAYSINENITKDGRTIICDWSNTPMKDNDGTVIGVLSMVQDITEQKQMEKELQTTQDRYRDFIEHSRDSVSYWKVPPGLKITLPIKEQIKMLYRSVCIEANQAGWKDLIKENSRDNVVGKKLAELFVPGPSIDETWAKFIKSNYQIDNHEINLTISNDQEFFRLASWYGVVEDGILTHFWSTSKDITERKEAESALRESELRFRNLANSLPQIVYEMDKEGFITYANQKAFDLLGYTQEDIDKGLNIFQLAIPEDRDKARENLQRRFEGEEVGPQEYTALRKDGSTFPVTTHVNVITRKGEYIGARGIMIDDTKPKKEEKERKILEQQLIQAQKMEAIGTLAGGVAHDFNNLLTTILGYSSLILGDLDRDNPLYKDIEEIKRAGEMGSNLTRQLLAFSRKQIAQPSILDLNELLLDTEKMLGRLIEEDIEIQIIPFPELYLIEIDPGQLEQVIMNLAINARDAMPNGGNIVIEVTNEDLGESFFSNHGFTGQTGSYVRLSVTDTGKGMEKETEAHIFEPFYTTKESGKGTGLGLSTVYGIIKQNNGYILVDTEPDKGCTFNIYFPRAKSGVVSEKKEQHYVTDLTGSETILFVEDDDSLRQLSQSVLEKKGYKVLMAEDGEDALRISKRHDGSIDLLVTDVIMPEINGKEVAERLQPLFPHMKVIFMSGYTDEVIAHHGILDSDLNFLEKPFAPEELIQKVREILDNK